MRNFFFILFCSKLIFAMSSQELYRLYQAEEYSKACDAGIRALQQHKSDEKFVSLYAFSCLHAEKIDRLALPIIMLGKNGSSRKNAAYFSIILMQKKLLTNALADGEKIDSVKLPTTDYLLSKVFDMFVNTNQQPGKRFYHFADPVDKRLAYRLFLSKTASSPLLIIEEYYDTILTKRHIYK